MRRVAFWLLILALVLLAACVLWLLPRLLREPPRSPETDVAATQAGPAAAGADVPGEGGDDATAPAGGAGAAASSTAASGTPAGGAEEAELARLGRIFGRLVDRAGHPVAGATVLAAHAADLGRPAPPRVWWIEHLPLDVVDPRALSAEVPLRATSDAYGAFVFDPFEPGRARLAVRSARFGPLDRDDLLVVPGESLDLGEIRLEPGVRIRGRVSDPDGTSLSGAPLVLHDDFAGATLPPLSPAVGVTIGVTNARGEFFTPPLGSGPKTLLASGGVELADAWLRPPPSTEGALVEAQLADAVWIEGRLRTSRFTGGEVFVLALPAASSREPVPFACRADARRTRVFANGSFSLPGLTRHEIYELRASAPGRTFEETSAWCPPTFALADAEGVLVAWEPDASITFSLVDAQGRTSFAECACTFEGALPARTLLAAAAQDSHGLRRIAEVRPASALQRARCTLATRSFRPIAQNLELEPGADLELGPLRIDPVPLLAVRVVDALSGLAVEGAVVTATESDVVGVVDAREPVDASGLPALPSRTDVRGEARVVSFGGTASELRVEAAGYAPFRQHGPFGGGYSEPRLEVALRRGAIVRVRALDADGDPVPGARIEHVEGSWSPNEAPRERVLWSIGVAPEVASSRIADRKGEAVFAHLAPGRHAFRVQRWKDYLDTEWTLRELADGEELELELGTEPWSSLELRVVDRAVPLADAPVVLLRRESVESPLDLLDLDAPLPPGLRAQLDERGACTFRSVDPGRYLVTIGIEGQHLRGLSEVVVRAGGTSLTIDLAQDELRGRVLVGDGEPGVGAMVYLSLRPSDRWSPQLRAPYRIADLPPTDHGDPLRALGEIAAVVADESGGFRILGLPRGEPFGLSARSGYYWLGRGESFVLHAGVAGEDASIQLSGAGAIEVEAAMRPASAPSILCALQPGRDGSIRFARAFPGVRVVFDALQPGEWQIFAAAKGSADDRFSLRDTVQVVEGEQVQANIRLP